MTRHVTPFSAQPMHRLSTEWGGESAMPARTIIWQVRLAVALVGIFLPTCGYASPSFNCNKATSPIEVLICASPGLAELDQELTDTFHSDIRSTTGDANASLLAAQRSWLLRRDLACQVPSKEAELRIREWDAMADCVSRLYRERIAELRPSESMLGESAESGGLVHPLCLDKVLESIWNTEPPAQESFSLKECSAEYAEVPVRISSRGAILAHSPTSTEYDEYKPTAILADGRQLLIVHDGGGSGIGSQVAILSRTNENGEIAVHGRSLFMGADRCGGFISGATPNGTGVFVDIDVNPDTFLQYAGFKTGPSGASPRYNACVGTIRLWATLEHQRGRKTETVSGIVKFDASDISEFPGDNCFNEAVAKIPGTLPKKLDRAALAHLLKFYKACLAKVQGNGLQ
jgi:uncharacterized protein YecT (DUF1311 family)